MRRWVEVAEQKYPGQIFDAPADLYYKLARDAVRSLVDISASMHLDGSDLLDDSVYIDAAECAEATIAYRLSYKLFCIDASTGGHEQLDRLATHLDRSETPTHAEQVLLLRQNMTKFNGSTSNPSLTAEDVGFDYRDLD